MTTPCDGPSAIYRALALTGCSAGLMRARRCTPGARPVTRCRPFRSCRSPTSRRHGQTLPQPLLTYEAVRNGMLATSAGRCTSRWATCANDGTSCRVRRCWSTVSLAHDRPSPRASSTDSAAPTRWTSVVASRRGAPRASLCRDRSNDAGLIHSAYGASVERPRALRPRRAAAPGCPRPRLVARGHQRAVRRHRPADDGAWHRARPPW